MGGSFRRQRSTSATRRRAGRHCSSTTDVVGDEDATFHGLSPLILWLLASTSLIVVISPFASSSSSSTTINSRNSQSHHPTLAEIILDKPTKMYGNNNNNRNFGEDLTAQYDGSHPHQHHHPQQQQPHHLPGKQDFFPQFNRPMGLRWRDDSRMFSSVPTVMPILTEHRSASPFGRGGAASTSARAASSSHYDYDSPTLEDIDLIDVLWRSDIAGEKGTRQVAPADQYECDLQTLTEKSTVAPLTAEENARYEDLSKGYYQDFYPAFNANHNQKTAHQMKRECPDEHQQPQSPFNAALPTDKDLAELLEDVSREEGQLNLLFDDKHPILNNVSLSEGIVYTQANLTEMQEMEDSCNQISISSSPTSSAQPASLFNNTDDQTIQQWLPTEMTPADVFPSTNYVYVGMQNDSLQTVVSNGQIEYDHAYQAPTPLSPLIVGTNNNNGVGSNGNGRQQHTQTSPNSATVTATATASLFDSYHSQRHSFSDCTTDSSSTCSRLSSESPRYNSESSSTTTSGPITESRFYGKLVPNRGSRYERPTSPRSIGTRISRVVPLNAAGQRKRGRQSKDEQLASENDLPVSAFQISEMSLSELQQVLKNENLSEYQRQLIRKIRRRGKNKVAARTCRQRRTDRHDKAGSMAYM